MAHTEGREGTEARYVFRYQQEGRPTKYFRGNNSHEVVERMLETFGYEYKMLDPTIEEFMWEFVLHHQPLVPTGLRSSHVTSFLWDLQEAKILKDVTNETDETNETNETDETDEINICPFLRKRCIETRCRLWLAGDCGLLQIALKYREHEAFFTIRRD